MVGPQLPPQRQPAFVPGDTDQNQLFSAFRPGHLQSVQTDGTGTKNQNRIIRADLGFADRPVSRSNGVNRGALFVA